MISTLALTSTFVALAASAPLAKRFVQAPEYVFGDSYLSNATFGNFIAKEYAIKENSCGLTKFDTDYVVSIKTNHTNLEEVCNMQVNITNKDSGKWVLATIVDECLTCSYNYLLLSPAAYEKVASSSDSDFTATYTFSNYQAPDTSSTSGQGQAPAPKQQESSSSKKQESSSSKKQETSSSSAAPANNNDDKDYKTSTSSSSSSQQWQPAQEESSTSASSKTKQQEQDKPEYTTSTSSSKYYAPPTTSTSWTPEPTTSSTKWVETTKAQPTTTWTKQQETYTPQQTTTQQQQQQQPQSSYSGGQFSGRATYFYQAGQPGSCGNYNSDSAYIVAVNDAQMNGGLCGRSVRITNTANGQSISATVADTCPGCGYGSLDLSVGAFSALGSMGDGVLPISWSFA